MLTNYTTTPAIDRLLTFHNIKTNSNKQSYKVALSQQFFLNYDGNNTTILGHLVSNSAIPRNATSENTFHIETQTHSVLKSKVPEWKTLVKSIFISEGAEFFDLLSTALSTKQSVTLVFKLQGIYFTISSVSPDLPATYRNILACLLQEYSDSRDFVIRASKAIQDGTTLTFSAEEEELITQYLNQQLLRDLQASMARALTPKRPTYEIKSHEERIEDYVLRIKELEIKLKELQLLDYAMEAGLTNTTALMDELMSYLKDSKDFILDVHSEQSGSTTHLNLTAKAFLFIAETDRDFFKTSSIASEGHSLHNHPRAERILKDVMEHKIRVPITASYGFEIKDGRLDGIYGLRDWSTASRLGQTDNYLTNHHIDRFDCFDGNKRIMRAAITNNNPIGFFEVIRQCTSSINVFDSTVIKHIIADIEKLNVPMLVRRDTGWENILLEDYINETTQTERPEQTTATDTGHTS